MIAFTSTTTTAAPTSLVVMDEKANSSTVWTRLKNCHHTVVSVGNDAVTSSSSSSYSSSSSSSSSSLDSSENDDDDVNHGAAIFEDQDPPDQSSAASAAVSSFPLILKKTWTASELQLRISYKRNSWLALPCPTRTNRTRVLEDSARHTTRHRSLPSTALSSASSSSSSTYRSHSTRSRKVVRFSVVEVRTYDQTLGENPSVSYGAPIGLDWYYVEHNAVDMDLYEVTATTRRGHHHTTSSSRHSRSRKLNHYQRKQRLLQDYGVTRDDFRTAKKKAAKIRWQRSVTNYFSRTPSMRQIAAAIEDSIGVFRTIWKLKKTQT